MTQTQQKPPPGPALAAPATAAVLPKPIPSDRMIEASFVRGPTLIVILPGDERIEEGPQDIERWANVGARLCMHQHVEVSNDSGSFWVWCRVERVHGNPGTGLRALTLRFIVKPFITDLGDEPIARTGDWYVRHGGQHRRWMVITPAGLVAREGINTETEAKLICNSESRNPRPL